METVGNVYETRDLSQFTTIKGNRPPNPQHIRRLVASIEERGFLQVPIIVNEKYEVIDGQHRLLAAKETNTSIYYIIVPGYKLEHVHALNMNQKNWSKIDFMDGYADMGVEAYVKLRNFYNKNNDFSLTSCLAMCSNTANNSTGMLSQKYHKGRATSKNMKQVFEEGTWTGKNFDLAQEWANKIRMVKPYYDGYNRVVFVGTMINMFRNKNYDHYEFLNKLSMQPRRLVDAANREQSKLLIEEIYNYRRKNKVNLRY